MRRFGISGSWRGINDNIRCDIEQRVRNIILEGNGIVTGGALGVDYIATQIVLEEGDIRSQIRIYLPIALNNFCTHYLKRANEDVITNEEAKAIVSQLQRIYGINKDVIIDDTKYREANKESYYARNTKIIEDCDVLYAFQVNNSKGTQDAIDKAKQLGKKVIVKKYRV